MKDQGLKIKINNNEMSIKTRYHNETIQLQNFISVEILEHTNIVKTKKIKDSINLQPYETSNAFKSYQVNIETLNHNNGYDITAIDSLTIEEAKNLYNEIIKEVYTLKASYEKMLSYNDIEDLL